MKKNVTTLLTAALLAASSGIFAQNAGVGINTTAPNSTLDINGKLGITDLDGLQAPRLTRAELSAKGDALYGTNQKGALIYITDISTGDNSGPRVNIDAIGYYYFDGVVWQKLISSYNNIYNADGVLTNTRTVTQNGSDLKFVNQQTTTINNSAGLGIVQDSGTGTRSSMGFSNNGNYSLFIYCDTNSAAQIMATGKSSVLTLGTTNTHFPSGIDFITTSAGDALGEVRMHISPAGNITATNNLAVGYATEPAFGSEKLNVNGSIKTATATYPDYVFEEYYTGKSLLNSKYKFLNIYDTEKFIKQNNHLPGVTSINDLAKTENGLYSFNLSELSTQTLEKVEELYLHVIKQQRQIDFQKEQINKLVVLTQKLQKKMKSKKQ
ncbi:hypothetical protein J2795_003229 [Chryseobacterium bernardetii]|uniref:Peptidase S74 domain-containing protein n=2 Tax=Chryseobacterium TaxID=59732 RepID=A0A543EKJ9_9FLAO|nr:MULTISPECIES: hypothetical protein [Chryseobacterium]MDR6372113.1 hypothetical protein [Chryseobacterium vietnamense]MDR6442504.1 hypothetical protein [Chryseobacterium bernardetii]TQM22114.1 hypothetical protein FB551_1820 [Chryseobacterium aquifrigidense]